MAAIHGVFVRPESYHLFDITGEAYSLLCLLRDNAGQLRYYPLEAATELLQRHLVKSRFKGKALLITVSGRAVLEAIDALDNGAQEPSGPCCRFLHFPPVNLCC